MCKAGAFVVDAEGDILSDNAVVTVMGQNKLISNPQLKENNQCYTIFVLL